MVHRVHKDLRVIRVTPGLLVRLVPKARREPQVLLALLVPRARLVHRDHKGTLVRQDRRAPSALKDQLVIQELLARPARKDLLDLLADLEEGRSSRAVALSSYRLE